MKQSNSHLNGCTVNEMKILLLLSLLGVSYAPLINSRRSRRYFFSDSADELIQGGQFVPNKMSSCQ